MLQSRRSPAAKRAVTVFGGDPLRVPVRHEVSADSCPYGARMAREVQRRNRRLALLAVAGTLVVSLPHGSATGEAPPARCSCGPLEDDVAAADAVFVGAPTGVAIVTIGPAGTEQLWRFEVDQHLAGPDSDVLNVSGGGSLSNCRANFTTGDTVGIVAFWRDGHLAASTCGVVEPTALLEVTGDDGTPNWSLVAVISIVAAAGAAISLAMTKGQRRRRTDSPPSSSTP